ncbi:MAG: RNA-binding S4 domain-containing protein [Saprospiraceae bacterium]|nr:RNA-binding S4 domain-containing protein [Saprospiraceae bacterium]
MQDLQKVRLDKWIWAVRIFKSRTLSTEACRMNRVKVNGKISKASTLVAIGDNISLRKDHFNLEFKIEKLIDKRVGAPIAITCYTNMTPVEELNKFKNWYGTSTEFRAKGSGRPTKKERREIDDYKDNQWDGEELDFGEL